MKPFLLAIVLVSFFACNTKTKIIKPGSSGRINNVLVIMDNTDWKGSIGDSVRAILAKPLVGFPQDEPTFSLSQIALPYFTKILKPSRNIVSIAYGDKNSFSVSNDKFATPQTIVSIIAKDKNNLIQLLKKYETKIINTIRKSDFKIYQKKLIKKFWDTNNIETFRNLHAAIKIPYAYRKVYDSVNYIWFRKDIPRGYLNIQMYAVPIESEADLNGENIINIRNNYGKRFILGSKDGMYMTTEEAFTPLQFKTQIAGKKTFETRGTWEMKNDFMAGPFLNYSVFDKKNNRFIVLEGFIYAPNIRKRDYMFELEIIMKTLEID